jgi:hypothetical protein
MAKKIKIKQQPIPKIKYKSKIKREIENGFWEKLSNQFARPAEQKVKEDRSKIIYREVEDFTKNLPLLTIKELMVKYEKDEKQARSIRDSVHRLLLKQEQARADRAKMLASFQLQPKTQLSAPINTVPVKSRQERKQNIPKLEPEVPLSIKSGFELALPEEPHFPSEMTQVGPQSIPVVDDLQLSHDFQIAHTVLQKIRLLHGVDIRQHGEQTAIQEGFVYLVQHPLFAGWVKAGMTVDFELRMATYNVADPLSRFVMSRVKWAENRRQAEIALMEALGCVAEQRNGEWFKMDFERACFVFDNRLRHQS